MLTHCSLTSFRSPPTLNRPVDFRLGAVHQQPMADLDPPDLDLIFAALSDPTRRAILTSLLGGDRGVSELADPHDMSLAAISKHVQILARAGLVLQTRSGRTVVCRLLPDGLRAAGIWLQGVGGFDAEDYDALEALLVAALASSEGS
jgi:DNA-binding transcriptional ArsR family regulator